MAYIGKSPGTGVRNRFIYTATAAQTTFSGSDDHSRTLSYTDAEFTDVFLNGVKLDKSDYTATSGTSIVLGSGATAGDNLEVLAFDTFSVFSGDFSQDVTVGGDLTVDTNTLFVDSTNNRVGVGTVSPTASLEISGSDDSNNLIVGHNDTDFAVYNDSTVGEIRLKAEDGSGSNFAKYMTFYTQPSGSAAAERMRILPSGGITFNGDTAAANALDDYEEGTWTPTVAYGTISVIRALYTKIGRAVTVTATVQRTTATSSANSLTFAGLPFQSSLNGEWVGTAMNNSADLQTTGIVSYMYGLNSTDEILIYNNRDNASPLSMKHNEFGLNDYLYFTLTYFT